MLSYTKIIDDFDGEPDLRAIRQVVFVEEQACTPEEEWDDLDAVATHFLVRTAEHDPIGCARLIPLEDGLASLGRYAVLPAHRQQGFAARLLAYTIAYARSQGFTDLQLSAQVYVAALYEAAGFSRYGEHYQEAGIEHVRMTMNIASKRSEEPEVLGADPAVHRIASAGDYAKRIVELCTQARHRLLILTPDLETGVLDQPELADHIVGLVRAHARNHVRIICADDRSPVRSSNRLVAIARRITSSLEVRTLKRDASLPDQVYILADQTGVLLRHDHRGPSGFVCYHDPGLVRRLQDSFDTLWNQSEPSREIRPLTI